MAGFRVNAGDRQALSPNVVARLHPRDLGGSLSKVLPPGEPYAKSPARIGGGEDRVFRTGMRPE